MQDISLVIEMAPMGAQRTRSTGKFHYTPPKYRQWLKDFCSEMLEYRAIRVPDGTPVRLDIIAVFEIPKSRRKGKDAIKVGSWHTSTPDADNVTKAVADGLTQAGFWQDDRQAAWMSCRKVWGDVAGLEIHVREL
jgi:Holliday junction resolvase RusA-like endonuclease